MEARSHVMGKAILVMIGTIIGAGIFGLPALFSYAGLWAGSFLYWVLALAVLATHLLYVEVILASKGRNRLVGYAERTFGRKGFFVAAVTYPLQIIGVNFVYILLGGEFLAIIARLGGWEMDLLFWQVAFWMLGAGIVFFGLKIVAKAEAFATWLLIASMGLLVLVAGQSIQTVVTVAPSFERLLVPFGVFLFSLSGLSVIGEAVEIVGRHRRMAYRAITIGTLSAAFLSWLFGITLSLAAGGQPVRNPSEIMSILPAHWALIVPIVGFLAVITSYIATADDLTNSLRYDFKLKTFIAWALALSAPFCLLFLTSRDFLSAISFVGGIFSAVNGILVACVASRVLSKNKNGAPWLRIAPFFVMMVYGVGILHTFFYR